MLQFKFPLVLCLMVSAIRARDIVVMNDDGWAVASIRAQYAALTESGHSVVLSCSEKNESGTASSSAPPTPLTEPCEYDTCPTGSPAEGFNASDCRPLDAARYGIQTLAPRFFDGYPPDFIISGPNIGDNTGMGILSSGTVGAACEAAKEGIPAGAFSGESCSQVSYTTLASSPNASASIAARVYSALTTHVVGVLLADSGAPVLPRGMALNVSYSALIDGCAAVADIRWVFSRIVQNASAVDVETCGGTVLPGETEVFDTAGCYASVSVINATSKTDVDAVAQGAVLGRLGGLRLSCLADFALRGSGA
ncbi:sure-like protein [Amylocystis lapponica]|nr:sure-like protein [Amylocystis lapponica]